MKDGPDENPAGPSVRGQTNCLKRYRPLGKRLGNSRILEAAHDLHGGLTDTHDLRQAAARDFPRHAVMGQVIRQIGVVIGLTVILTFPVTVLTFPVSGAGSQKHAEQRVPVAAAGSKGAVETVATDISWPGRQELPR
jgi:hypothetical protein